MTDSRPHKTPGPDHPITLQPSPAHVVVRSGSLVIAETDRALAMREASYPTVLYVPLDDVDQRMLRQSDHHTYCPYKGEASYTTSSRAMGPISRLPSGTTTIHSRPSPRSKGTLRSMPTE